MQAKFNNVIPALCVLDQLTLVEAFVPEQVFSPMEQLKRKGRQGERATGISTFAFVPAWRRSGDRVMAVVEQCRDYARRAGVLESLREEVQRNLRLGKALRVYGALLARPAGSPIPALIIWVSPAPASVNSRAQNWRECAGVRLPLPLCRNA